MIKSRLLAGVALATLCLPVAALSPGMPLGVTTAQAQSISFQLFFDQLEPHGVWVRHARYNYVFCPTGVDTAWRPYSNGRWLYVQDRGWYFASDEPFAWATYHYGRWFADRELGWCWVPGTKWAPAWVSWRRGDNVVGWAPLPPEEDGYSVSIEVSRRELPEGYWVFVPTERFVEPDLSVSIVFGSQQPEYFAQTEFLGPVTVEGDLVVNNVIDVTYIEQTINQEVIVYQPEETEDPAAQTVDLEAQALFVFDQDIAAPTEEVAPPEAVEETEAAGTIEAEGGTAGATAELPAAEAGGEAATGAEAPAAEQPTEGATAPEGEVTTPTTEGEASQPATEAETGSQGEAATEAEEPATEEAVPAAESTGEEAVCPPEQMVDGQCPPAAEAEQPAAEQAAPVAIEPATEPAAPAEEPAATEAEPAAEAAPVTEAAPADEPAADAAAVPEEAPAPEAAPAEQPAAEATEPAEATPPKQQLCPPEVMVDGKCPVNPEQPAQQ